MSRLPFTIQSTRMIGPVAGEFDRSSGLASISQGVGDAARASAHLHNRSLQEQQKNLQLKQQQVGSHFSRQIMDRKAQVEEMARSGDYRGAEEALSWFSPEGNWRSDFNQSFRNIYSDQELEALSAKVSNDVQKTFLQVSSSIMSMRNASILTDYLTTSGELMNENLSSNDPVMHPQLINLSLTNDRQTLDNISYDDRSSKLARSETGKKYASAYQYAIFSATTIIDHAERAETLKSLYSSINDNEFLTPGQKASLLSKPVFHESPYLNKETVNEIRTALDELRSDPNVSVEDLQESAQAARLVAEGVRESERGGLLTDIALTEVRGFMLNMLYGDERAGRAGHPPDPGFFFRATDEQISSMINEEYASLPPASRNTILKDAILFRDQMVDAIKQNPAIALKGHPDLLDNFSLLEGVMGTDFSGMTRRLSPSDMHTVKGAVSTINQMVQQRVLPSMGRGQVGDSAFGTEAFAEVLGDAALTPEDRRVAFINFHHLNSGATEQALLYSARHSGLDGSLKPAAAALVFRTLASAESSYDDPFRLMPERLGMFDNPLHEGFDMADSLNFLNEFAFGTPYDPDNPDHVLRRQEFRPIMASIMDGSRGGQLSKLYRHLRTIDATLAVAVVDFLTDRLAASSTSSNQPASQRVAMLDSLVGRSAPVVDLGPVSGQVDAERLQRWVYDEGMLESLISTFTVDSNYRLSESQAADAVDDLHNYLLGRGSRRSLERIGSQLEQFRSLPYDTIGEFMDKGLSLRAAVDEARRTKAISRPQQLMFYNLMSTGVLRDENVASVGLALQTLTQLTPADLDIQDFEMSGGTASQQMIETMGDWAAKGALVSDMVLRMHSSLKFLNVFDIPDYSGDITDHSIPGYAQQVARRFFHGERSESLAEGVIRRWGSEGSADRAMEEYLNYRPLRRAIRNDQLVLERQDSAGVWQPVFTKDGKPVSHNFDDFMAISTSLWYANRPVTHWFRRGAGQAQ